MALVTSFGLTLAVPVCMMQAEHTPSPFRTSTQPVGEPADTSTTHAVGLDIVALLGVSDDEASWLARGPETASSHASVVRCVRRGGPTQAATSALLNGFELRHPNLMEVRNVFQSEAGPCVVTEYAESVTLADVLSIEEPLPPAIACRIFADAVRGLQVLHTMCFSCEGVPYFPLAHGRIAARSIAIGLDGITRLDDALGTLVRKLCGGTSRLDVGSSRRDQRADVAAVGELLWAAIGHGTRLGDTSHPSDARSDLPRELGDLIVLARGRGAGGFANADELFHELTTLATKYRALASATEVSSFAVHSATILATRESCLRRSRDEIAPPPSPAEPQWDEEPMHEPEVNAEATIRLDARALLSIGERLGAWEADADNLGFAATATMPMFAIEDVADRERMDGAPSAAEAVDVTVDISGDMTPLSPSRDASRETIRFEGATNADREAMRKRSQLPTVQFRVIRPVREPWGWRRWVSVGAATAILSALTGVVGAKLVNHIDDGGHEVQHASAAVRSFLIKVAAK